MKKEWWPSVADVAPSEDDRKPGRIRRHHAGEREPSGPTSASSSPLGGRRADGPADVAEMFLRRSSQTGAVTS